MTPAEFTTEISAGERLVFLSWLAQCCWRGFYRRCEYASFVADLHQGMFYGTGGTVCLAFDDAAANGQCGAGGHWRNNFAEGMLNSNRGELTFSLFFGSVERKKIVRKQFN